jgi:hypothetical protein
MSVRGTMTSATVFSPISKIELIISCSVRSRTPCAWTGLDERADLVLGHHARLWRGPPNGRTMTCVTRNSTVTMGRVSQVMSSSGNARSRSVPCACRAAMARGRKAEEHRDEREHRDRDGDGAHVGEDGGRVDPQKEREQR